MNAPPSSAFSAASPAPTLLASALVREVAGRRLLDGADLTLRHGELVGLIGPNGAGKSTLLRLLAGLTRPDSGRIDIGGSDLARLSAPDKSRLISYVPQDFAPAWDFSVRDLLDMGRERAPQPVPLERLITEHGLEALQHRRWSQMSGGERARVLLASVLAAPSQVLLADEPGASLDIAHRISLLKTLQRQAVERIVVVVLHDLDLAARFCDRLVLLAHGRIVKDGSAAEVIAAPELDESFGIRFRRVATEGGAVHLFAQDPDIQDPDMTP